MSKHVFTSIIRLLLFTNSLKTSYLSLSFIFYLIKFREGNNQKSYEDSPEKMSRV